MSAKKRNIGFHYAWEGWKTALKTERNLQIHLIAAILVIVFSFFLDISRLEWLAVIFAIGFVIMAELVNSAIEALLDYVKPEEHPVAKQIKDIAAAAVLVSACTAAVIGCIIFMPKVLAFF